MIRLNASLCAIPVVLLLTTCISRKPPALPSEVSSSDPAARFRDHMLIFNPNTDIRNGETAEYSTLAAISERIRSVSSEPPGMIGLGESIPLLDAEDRSANEVLVWDNGKERVAYTSDPKTGAAVPL